MEVLSPFEGLDEGDWISPRISFSQDYQFPGRCSPKLQFKASPEEEFSFNFRNSANQDPPTDDSMLSADELFFNGKLRPLQKGVDDHVRNAYSDQRTIVGCEEWRIRSMSGGRSIEDNPRCFSMTIESCRGGDVRGSRAYMSLNNSRCSSPSRTMSMPRTTPTSPKASSSITSASPASLTSSFMSTPWMSSSLTSSSTTSKYSNKFKDFFKLKKMSAASKDASVSSVPSSSVSAEISRECPQSSSSASCRHPSRSFWPFSRSNSAGESKSAPVVSPPPRRSNSAGEGKTTSSSLLPTGIPPPKQPAQRTHKDLTCLATSSNPPSNGCSIDFISSSSMPTNAYTDFLRSSSNAAVKCLPTTAMSKKGLPPLPNSSFRKTGSFFATAHCGSDAAIVSSQPSSSMQACASSHKNSETAKAAMSAEQSPTSTGYPLACSRETAALPDARNPNGDYLSASDVNPMRQKIRPGTTSPARPVRRGSHTNASRNFARSSPGRRGVWTSPGRGNGGRVTIRNLDRGSVSSKGHVRPKDMLSRDGASGRISPVINVAIPSLRGSKTSSKSKVFSLGNLFNKKEKVSDGLRAALPTPDSQSGG